MSLVIDVDDGMTPVYMVIMRSVMLLIVWEEPAYYLLSDLSAMTHGRQCQLSFWQLTVLANISQKWHGVSADNVGTADTCADVSADNK